MDATAHVSVSKHGSRYVAAFEAGGEHGPSALARFLPPNEDPDFLWVLEELVRADLHHQWDTGTHARLADYVAEFPDLHAAPAALRALAAEEWDRWRDRTGDTPPPTPGPNLARTPAPSGLVDLFRTRPSPAPAFPAAKPTGLVAGVGTEDTPSAADDVPAARFPKTGERFFGFDLVDVLGTGAFARVFLAEEIGLARRRVALKVTTKATREPQRLARLRHTNIVPVYSVHDHAPLQAVCMPFLGRQTLADLIKLYRETGSIPHCGHHHGHRTTAAVGRDSTVVAAPSSPTVPAADPAAADPVWDAAAGHDHGMTHPEFVAWLVARLADGLAHAHDRGLLHLDLKPANVLFADDGQPLLLDFNLSYDVRTGDRERHGGTLPYMAPEQIEEFRDGGPTRVDQRTDLYAVGVMFFELLTGRHPFPLAAPADKAKPDLDGMVAARRAGPPSPRAANPAVPLAVDAVVRKLLAPDPAGRYESAHDLLTDLERHRAHLPLAFAPNPSAKERATKWLRRHPRALFHVLLAGMTVATGGLAVAAYRQAGTRSRADAVGQYAALRAAVAKLRVDLVVHDEAVNRPAAIETGRRWLAAYRLTSRADWAQWPAVADLPPAERAAVPDDLGELALLLAHAEWRAGSRTNPEEAATRAREWHRIAESCYQGQPVPPSLIEQRKQLGVTAAAAAAPPATAPESATDHYLRAAACVADRNLGEAIPHLERLTATAPEHFAGHFVLAIARQLVGHTPQALERYQIAQALAPADARPAFQRGQLLTGQHRAADAEVAFTEAVRRDPAHGPSYRGRAVARTKLRTAASLKGALDDLAKAMTHGVSPLQVHLLRAAVYDELGDAAAATRDRAAAAPLTPVTPTDYLVRGSDRVTSDPAGALDDFAAAAAARADLVVAHQNAAHVLADKLGRTADALAAQEKAVAANERFGPARAGLAVLLARLGRAQEARESADKALVLSGEAGVAYQAACTFALTSAAAPADADRAVRLLREAFQKGYRNFDVLDRDPDLDPLRTNPEFVAAVAAAKDVVK